MILSGGLCIYSLLFSFNSVCVGTQKSSFEHSIFVSVWICKGLPVFLCLLSGIHSNSLLLFMTCLEDL